MALKKGSEKRDETRKVQCETIEENIKWLTLENNEFLKDLIGIYI